MQIVEFPMSDHFKFCFSKNFDVFEILKLQTKSCMKLSTKINKKFAYILQKHVVVKTRKP